MTNTGLRVSVGAAEAAMFDPASRRTAVSPRTTAARTFRVAPGRTVKRMSSLLLRGGRPGPTDAGVATESDRVTTKRVHDVGPPTPGPESRPRAPEPDHRPRADRP